MTRPDETTTRDFIGRVGAAAAAGGLSAAGPLGASAQTPWWAKGRILGANDGGERGDHRRAVGGRDRTSGPTWTTSSNASVRARSRTGRGSSGYQAMTAIGMGVQAYHEVLFFVRRRERVGTKPANT